ncbi:MAG: hypothetical protein L6247_04980 [Desulfobacteraceae bacterium]|nr:hypothetical protein [Desulfobacteraceae bacterium]
MENKNKNDGSEEMAVLLNLCESDPDAGMEFIEGIISKKPELSTDLFFKFAKAMAYKAKSFQQVKKAGLIESINDMNLNDLVNEIQPLLAKDDVKYLELALTEIRQILDVNPEFINMMGNDDEAMGEAEVEAICSFLERCKPGSVQKILFETKLEYFGQDRIRVASDVSSLGPSTLYPFTLVKFSADSIAKSALLADYGTDIKGRKFIMCLLYKRLYDDLSPEETFEDAIYVGTVYLFDDNTFAYDVEKMDQTESRQDKKKGFLKKLFS